MPISEPMTLLTDYLLAAVTWLLAWRMLRDPSCRSQRAVRFWAAAFIFAGGAAAFGGTVHGFVLILAEPLGALLWKATVGLVGAGGWALLVATAFATLRGRVRSILIVLATVKLVFYLNWMIDHDAFRYVIYDYAPALLLVLLLQTMALLRFGDRAAGWIVAGVLLSFVGAAIQAVGFSLHRYFNHNDLYHLVQMAAFCLWYRGGLLLRDRQP